MAKVSWDTGVSQSVLRAHYKTAKAGALAQIASETLASGGVGTPACDVNFRHVKDALKAE